MKTPNNLPLVIIPDENEIYKQWDEHMTEMKKRYKPHFIVRGKSVPVTDTLRHLADDLIITISKEQSKLNAVNLTLIKHRNPKESF